MTYQNGKIVFRVIVVALIVVSIVGYSLYQAQNLIKGPQISIESPQNGATLDSSAVVIKGTAKNVAFISLNDRQIFVDESGIFNEELLLGPGYNVWKLEAKDKFGRIVSKKIELVFRNS